VQLAAGHAKTFGLGRAGWGRPRRRALLCSSTLGVAGARPQCLTGGAPGSRQPTRAERVKGFLCHKRVGPDTPPSAHTPRAGVHTHPVGSPWSSAAALPAPQHHQRKGPTAAQQGRFPRPMPHTHTHAHTRTTPRIGCSLVHCCTWQATTPTHPGLVLRRSRCNSSGMQSKPHTHLRRLIPQPLLTLQRQGTVPYRQWAGGVERPYSPPWAAGGHCVVELASPSAPFPSQQSPGRRLCGASRQQGQPLSWPNMSTQPKTPPPLTPHSLPYKPTNVQCGVMQWGIDPGNHTHEILPTYWLLHAPPTPVSPCLGAAHLGRHPTVPCSNWCHHPQVSPPHASRTAAHTLRAVLKESDLWQCLEGRSPNTCCSAWKAATPRPSSTSPNPPARPPSAGSGSVAPHVQERPLLLLQWSWPGSGRSTWARRPPRPATPPHTITAKLGEQHPLLRRTRSSHKGGGPSWLLTMQQD
jgi:hypothetical protein